MNIIHVGNSNLGGGASRAMLRIHESLISIGCNSSVWVNHKVGDNKHIYSKNSKLHKVVRIFKTTVAKIMVSFLKTPNTILHSPQIFSSSWIKMINESDADIIHLHWFQHEMLSISDIPKIKKPLIWTLHDMWGFCGAEHISYENRWIDGYNKKNRSVLEKGFDLNRWTWNRKRKYWKKPIQLTVPSEWMMHSTRKSFIMREWPVEYISNPLNTNVWKPIDKKLARDAFNLPQEVPIIMFGALSGVSEFHKGYDLLEKALNSISKNNRIKKACLVVFGQSEPVKPLSLDIQIKYLGHLNDDVSLRVAYSTADVFVVPSRIESFAQTASESQACGVPVVAFNTTGLKTTVIHKKTGYLAEKFDTNDLAKGILWVLENVKNKLSKNSRKSAIDRFSYPKIAKLYLDLYKKTIEN